MSVSDLGTGLSPIPSVGLFVGPLGLGLRYPWVWKPPNHLATDYRTEPVPER